MAFVSDIGFRRVGIGQTITVYGGGLDVGCRVYFGGTEATILDFDEGYIEALAPLTAGDYDVTVECNGTTLTAGRIHVSSLAETPQRSFAHDYTQDDFESYVQGLMPRGIALAKSRTSNFGKLRTAIAMAFLYVWNVIKSMLKATDPAHTDNYDAWESELGLPIIPNSTQSGATRLAEIYRTECTEGGCTKAFFKKMLVLMGIDADVYEYTADPEEFSGYDFGTDDPRYYAKILFHVSEDDISMFRAGESAAGDYLLDYSQYMEESVFDAIKQAHIKIIYGYDDGSKMLTTEDGIVIVTEDGKALITEPKI